MSRYDFLIVGAGFSGLVLAERLTTQLHKKCLVVEKRNHIGGNAYDHYDDAGILIHAYGPHYFRTNSPKIIDYLSQFTDWHHVNYEIKSWSDNRFWSFPINLNTFEELIGKSATEEQFIHWLEQQRIPIENPRNSEEVITSQVGQELYRKFFHGYTLKQWQREPRELDPSVCGRIPIRTNRDNRYLRESFQALPKDGYTAMFNRMIEASGNLLEILLETHYRQLPKKITWDHMIYTGPIDQFYDCRFGALPYRSLRFEPESFTAEQLKSRQSISSKPHFWQPAMQVNYPNDFDFTRIVELKHATGQTSDRTTIIREFPEPFTPEKEPYYPIPTDESKHLYQQYATLAQNEKNTSFIGRLATYRYYNMDQVTAQALTTFEKFASRNEA